MTHNVRALAKAGNSLNVQPCTNAQLKNLFIPVHLLIVPDKLNEQDE
jgi:hypothetical protein